MWGIASHLFAVKALGGDNFPKELHPNRMDRLGITGALSNASLAGHMSPPGDVCACVTGVSRVNLTICLFLTGSGQGHRCVAGLLYTSGGVLGSGWAVELEYAQAVQDTEVVRRSATTNVLGTTGEASNERH